MRGSFLSSPKEAHDRVSIFNSWRMASAGFPKEGLAHTTARARGAKGQRGRHPLSDPCPGSEELASVKSNVQSYFIHMSTAITVSAQRRSECIISSVYLKADSLTITEQPLLLGQLKSWIWFFSPPESQESLFCNYFPLLSSSWHISCSLIDSISPPEYRAS